MNFNPSAFVDNLSYLLVGMVSIFIVIGLISLVTYIINKIFTKNK